LEQNRNVSTIGNIEMSVDIYIKWKIAILVCRPEEEAGSAGEQPASNTATNVD
jgi:hypothetical protein